jgi:acetyl esterase/lipase
MEFATEAVWADRPHVTFTRYLHERSEEYRVDRIRPAVIVCPGGGYLATSDREAEPVALRFSALGYQAFVLRYSTYSKVPGFIPSRLTGEADCPFPQPLYDLAQAVKLVREHAAQWRADPDKITVVGFSAGGHLAASLGVHWHESFLSERLEADAVDWKPNALVLAYPLLDFLDMRKRFGELKDSQGRSALELTNRVIFGVPKPTEDQLAALCPARFVSERTPPSFLWHTAGDRLIHTSHSLQFAAALAEHGVPYELHVFERGDHGLSLADATTANDEAGIVPNVAVWFELAARWLTSRFYA